MWRAHFCPTFFSFSLGCGFAPPASVYLHKEQLYGAILGDQAGEVEDFFTSSIMVTIPQHSWSWKGAS